MQLQTAPVRAPLTYASALELIGGLSEPGKMPWWGWSTPADACITGSKLRKAPNSVCSECYALKGRYHFPRTKNALKRRLAAITHPDFVDAFVLVLTKKYERTKATYVRDGLVVKENRFRWHDSGDLSSLDHLKKINEIALRTPFLDHWLSTREFSIVRQFKGPFAPNLVVRMSFPFVGGKSTNSTLPQSTVGRDNDPDLHQCPALRFQGNKCLDCRACWSRADVNYPLH